jgi:hemolysin D
MTARPQYERVTSPTLHATILFTIFVFLAILVMSFVFKVEVVARGKGRVVPLSRVQIVQSEFPGRVASINVRNGSAVNKGDVLIELDVTEAASQLSTIAAERDRLLIETVRIDAMAYALSLDMSATGAANQIEHRFSLPQALSKHAFAAEQRALLSAEIDDLTAAISQNKQRADVNRESEDVTRAGIARIDASLAIQGERLAAASKLLEKGAISRAAYLDVRQAYSDLERERDVYLKELDQKAAERLAIDGERRRLLTDIRRSLMGRRTEISARLATLAEDERVARRRLDLAKLEAPVAGVVDQLRIYTIGGVISSGEELLRIVPADVKVEVEGAFPNQDAGFLKIGQRANIRLDAYPSERFGFVLGEVSDVAADSIEFKDGLWGYLVRVTPQKPFLKAGEHQYDLRPGMTATVDVVTEERRIISYFFAPIVETIEGALGER